MTNRTIKFRGQGFGNVPVKITVTANESLVYQGTINTLNQPMPNYRYPSDQFVDVFDLTVPVNFVGTIPMSVSVQSGSGMLLADCNANYNLIYNPIYTPAQLAIITGPTKTAEALAIFESLANPPLSQTEIDVLANPASTDSECDAVLAAHGLTILVPGGPGVYDGSFCNNDTRINVALNGDPVLVPVTRPPEFDGDWTRPIPANSTLTFLLKVEFAGIE